MMGTTLVLFFAMFNRSRPDLYRTNIRSIDFKVYDHERTKPVTELYCIDHPLGANDVAHVADCCAGRSSEVENLSCILGEITKVAEEGKSFFRVLTDKLHLGPWWHVNRVHSSQNGGRQL